MPTKLRDKLKNPTGELETLLSQAIIVLRYLQVGTQD